MDSCSTITRAQFNYLATKLSGTGKLRWSLKSCTDDMLGERVWLQCSDIVTRNLARSMVTFYVFYNAEYQQPQVGFSVPLFDSSADDDGVPVRNDGAEVAVKVLTTLFPNVALLNVTEVSEKDQGKKPLASYAYCHEVDSPLWVVHPCDTTHVLHCGRLDGLCGDVLSTFLIVMAPFLGLPTSLVPWGNENEEAGCVAASCTKF